MTYYKLTRADNTTRDGCLWTPGEWRVAELGEMKPCTATALHAYTSPLLAVLLAPEHGLTDYPLLWSCETEGETGCDGLKAWASRLRIIEQVEMPVFTPRQRVLAAIFWTQLVLARGAIPNWDTWADAYVSCKAEAWAAEAWAAARAGAAARVVVREAQLTCLAGLLLDAEEVAS